MTADPGSPGVRIYLLFDIDGTLMEAEGAGRAALERPPPAFAVLSDAPIYSAATSAA